ncbi:hypothetical protein ACK2DA_002574 [Salmonella enterica]
MAKTIGANQTITVKQNQVQTVVQNQQETVVQNQSVTVGLNQAETVGIVRALSVGEACQRLRGGDEHLSGTDALLAGRQHLPERYGD